MSAAYQARRRGARWTSTYTSRISKRRTPGLRRWPSSSSPCMIRSMVCANSSFATSIDFGSLSDNHGTRASHVCATAVRKRIPRGARIIDAEGNVLITGLWDRYSHSLGRWNGRPCQCVRWRDPVGYLAKRDRQSGPIPRTRCRLETISSCKLADLMLLEANPLENIDHTNASGWLYSMVVLSRGWS